MPRPKGYKHSEETLKKMRVAQQGEKNHAWGKKQTKEPRAKISKANKGKPGPWLGKKLTDDHKKNLSDAHSGDKAYNWQGEKVSYGALHTWVSRVLGSPQYCEDCKRTKPPKGMGKTRSYFQWANISGKYKREVSDWRRLCYRCHGKFDSSNR